MKKEMTIQELGDPSSPYYCGSAALLSLYHLVYSLRKEFKKLYESPDYLLETISSLCYKDADLFSIIRKEDMNEEDAEQAADIFYAYADLFDALPEVITFISKEYQPLFDLSLSFLKKTIKEACNPPMDKCPTQVLQRAVFELSLTYRYQEIDLGMGEITSIPNDVLLDSSKPLLAMLSKLTKRKNQGKKPFSQEFDFEKKISSIDVLIDKETISKEEILEAAIIAKDASSEIKMASLKEDYLYIASYLEAVSSLL